MATMIHTTDAPTAGIGLVTNAPAVAPARREGRPATEPGEAARELDAEVARLLRVRRGELAEPLLWQRPSHIRMVDEVVAHLAPIRSRLALLSSWEREAHRDAATRLAYAIVWVRLAQRRAGEYGQRRSVVRHRLITARA